MNIQKSFTISTPSGTIGTIKRSTINPNTKANHNRVIKKDTK